MKARTARSLWRQPQKVVDRYVRLLMFRKANQFARAVARWKARRSLTRNDRPRAKALARALTSCAREAIRARREGLYASEVVLNMALYFLVAERDIQAVKIDALTHPDPWKRSLYARVILLTIHELELDATGGAKLRQALEVGRAPEELKRELTRALRKVRAAQQKAKKQFADMRHSVIAHRDSDAIMQYRSIIAMDGLSVIQTAADFYAGVDEFMAVMPRVLSHVGGLRGVIAQLVAKEASVRSTHIPDG